MCRSARELALQLLFQQEFAPQIDLQEFLQVFEEQPGFNRDILSYANRLAIGVIENKSEIDGLIQAAARHWSIGRMALVDRNIIRIATYEMRYSDELIETKIAIDEAVEIAKRYGTKESSSFINGVLDQIQKGE
jgi:transcription antitermination protein NusB